MATVRRSAALEIALRRLNGLYLGHAQYATARTKHGVTMPDPERGPDSDEGCVRGPASVLVQVDVLGELINLCDVV